MTEDPIRQKIGQSLADLMTGFPVETAMLALADCLGASVTMCSETPENADRIIDEIAANSKQYVRSNWSYIKDQMPSELQGKDRR